MDEKTIARFWSKVDRNGPTPPHMPHLGQCWVWTGARRPDGYVNFVISDPRPRKVLGHRLAWFLVYGHWPTACALHACDGGSIGCVRPGHLFLGTRRDNALDMIAKGRRYDFRGERNGRAVFSEEDVRRIRSAHACGESQNAIALRLGVTARTIRLIVLRETWRHVR